MSGYALDDLVMLRRFQEIVQEHHIQAVVETGINEGLSTIKLAEMVPLVFAVDNDIAKISVSAANFGRANVNNIVLCLGDSPGTLLYLQPVLPDKTLYFLDAHWQSYWPLRDEIRSIRKGTGIIVLHDVQVPNHPELGFDTYSHVLNYDYVRDVLTEWSPTHRIEYNEKTGGTSTPRGVMYCYPE